MAIYYLDIDDEITSAAARLRDSSDGRIALVLSVGSRVATSRINFRLLSREAKKRSKRLAIIAADPSIQSVARSAELPVYASVGEYERSEAAMAGGPGGRHPDAVKDALDELALTVAPGIAAAASAMPAPKGVVVRVQNGRTQWVDVRTGLTAGPLLEVFGDLRPGDTIAARATDEMPPGTRVLVREPKAAAS